MALMPGPHPSIMIALANAVGAHPWFVIPMLAADSYQQAPTAAQLPNYVSSLASLCQSALNPGLIPRFEGPNETWNWIFWGTSYAWTKEYFRAGAYYRTDDWYGTCVSLIGQAVAASYGVTQAIVKTQTSYQVICGFQAASFTGSVTSSYRLGDSGAQYVKDGGSPAYNWVTHITAAGYFNPAYYATSFETTMAANYASNNSTYAYLLDAYANSANPPVWSNTTAYSANNADGTTAVVVDPYNNQAYLATQNSTGLQPHSNSSYWTTGPSSRFALPGLNGIYGHMVALANQARYGGLKVTQYEGGYSPDTTGTSQQNTFRWASSQRAVLQSLTVQNFTNFQNAGSNTEFPAEYQFSNAGSNIWGIWNPDIYQSRAPPRWQGILQWDAIK
jgi:hypothetical protein